MISLTLAALFLLSSQEVQATDAEPLAERIKFPSSDGLNITADLYRANEDPATPMLVLFHQARSSRGEYREVAPRLKALGYNCLAVDLRSGGTMGGVKNGTSRAFGRPATYLESLPDMEAALAHARAELAKGKLVAWGSSYSSALTLYLAGTKPELADGAIAFSPGEYFGRYEKPADWIATACGSIRVPVFITSARSEKDEWAKMLAAIPGEDKVDFLPEVSGHHGSRALMKKNEGHESYWKALEGFLSKYFPTEGP